MFVHFYSYENFFFIIMKTFGCSKVSEDLSQQGENRPRMWKNSGLFQGTQFYLGQVIDEVIK